MTTHTPRWTYHESRNHTGRLYFCGETIGASMPAWAARFLAKAANAHESDAERRETDRINRAAARKAKREGSQ